MRKIYGERREMMCEILGSAGMKFVKPNGGMSLWVELGVDSDEVVRQAAALGLPLRPGSAYSLDSDRIVRNLRLGFASSTEEEMREGLALLVQAWERARG